MTNLETHKCDYGCGNDGVFYLKTADKWSCKAKFRECPGFKAELSKRVKLRHYNNPINVKRRENKRLLEAGELKCKYCGSRANYLLHHDNPCCVNKARLCPEYGNMQRDYMNNYYKTPGAKAAKRAKLREVQNRPKVKAAKMVKMMVLHKGNCEPCVEFQENYNIGIAKRKLETKERHIEYLTSKGYDIPDDDKERAILVNRVKSKYRTRELLSSNVDINTKIEGGL